MNSDTLIAAATVVVGVLIALAVNKMFGIERKVPDLTRTMKAA